jgi:virulence factor Mce-like protein
VITSRTRVPASSTAEVRSLSPVGEQYLDFQPSSAEGPYLGDGSVVEADAVDLPLSLGSTVIAVNRLLDQVDDGKVRSILLELSAALEGTGDDIGSLVDDGSLVLEELEAVWPETERLLQNADTVLDIGTDNDAELARLARNGRTLAAFLKDVDPELRAQIRRTPGQLRQLQAVIDDVRRVLPDFLRLGVSVTDIVAMYEPHTRALLQNYSPGLRTLLTNYVRDGQLKLKFLPDKDPRCSYDNPRRSPREVASRPFYRDGECPASFTTLQRGAAQAPGPVR